MKPIVCGCECVSANNTSDFPSFFESSVARKRCMHTRSCYNIWCSLSSSCVAELSTYFKCHHTWHVAPSSFVVMSMNLVWAWASRKLGTADRLSGYPSVSLCDNQSSQSLHNFQRPRVTVKRFSYEELFICDCTFLSGTAARKPDRPQWRSVPLVNHSACVLWGYNCIFRDSSISDMSQL